MQSMYKSGHIIKAIRTFCSHLQPAGQSPVAMSASALILAYGAARAGTVLCNEGRNMVFANVGDVAA